MTETKVIAAGGGAPPAADGIARAAAEATAPLAALRQALGEASAGLDRLLAALAGGGAASTPTPSPQAEEAKRALDEFNKRVGDKARELGRDISTHVYGRLLDPSKTKSTVEFFKDLFKKIAIEALAANVVVPIMTQVVGSVPGLFGIPMPGGAGPGGLSAASVPGLFGGGLTGTGTAAGSWLSKPIFGSAHDAGVMSLPKGLTNAPGLTWGQALGMAGAGFTAGSLVGGMLGTRANSKAVGGLSGVASGAAMGAMVGGPVGAVIGAVAGGLGGLLGTQKRSVGPIATSALAVRDGRFVGGVGVSTDNGGDASPLIEQTQAIAAQLNALKDAYGLSLDAARMPFGGLYSGGGNPWGPAGTDDPAALVRAVIGSGVLVGQGTSGTVLAGSRATTLEALDADLAFGRLYGALVEAERPLGQVEQAMAALSARFEEASKRAGELGLDVSALASGMRTSFERDVRDAILAIEDPARLALEQQERDAAARLETARTLGADLAQVERLNALERLRIQERANAEQAAAAEEAARRQVEAARTLKDWLDGQALGPTSALTGTARLAEAQSQFASALSAARDGTGEVGRVTRLADAILALSRDLYGGTEQGAFLAQAVRSQVESLGRSLDLPGFAGSAPGSSAASAAEAGGFTRDDARELTRAMLVVAEEVRALRASGEAGNDRLERVGRRLDQMLNRVA
jgi:hypothetical protein